MDLYSILNKIIQSSSYKSFPVILSDSEEFTCPIELPGEIFFKSIILDTSDTKYYCRRQDEFIISCVKLSINPKINLPIYQRFF